MERFIKRTLMAAVVLSAAVAANAQRWVEITDDATPVICISETVNEAPDVVEIFQNTQSAYHHDPRAPRFVLVDQKGKWGLGIGGYLQTKIEYDCECKSEWLGEINNSDMNSSTVEIKHIPLY